MSQTRYDAIPILISESSSEEGSGYEVIKDDDINEYTPLTSPAQKKECLASVTDAIKRLVGSRAFEILKSMNDANLWGLAVAGIAVNTLIIVTQQNHPAPPDSNHTIPTKNVCPSPDADALTKIETVFYKHESILVLEMAYGVRAIAIPLGIAGLSRINKLKQLTKNCMDKLHLESGELSEYLTLLQKRIFGAANACTSINAERAKYSKYIAPAFIRTTAGVFAVSIFGQLIVDLLEARKVIKEGGTLSRIIKTGGLAALTAVTFKTATDHYFNYVINPFLEENDDQNQLKWTLMIGGAGLTVGALAGTYIQTLRDKKKRAAYDATIKNLENAALLFFITYDILFSITSCWNTNFRKNDLYLTGRDVYIGYAIGSFVLAVISFLTNQGSAYRKKISKVDLVDITDSIKDPAIEELDAPQTSSNALKDFEEPNDKKTDAQKSKQLPLITESDNEESSEEENTNALPISTASVFAPVSSTNTVQSVPAQTSTYTPKKETIAIEVIRDEMMTLENEMYNVGFFQPATSSHSTSSSNSTPKHRSS